MTDEKQKKKEEKALEKKSAKNLDDGDDAESLSPIERADAVTKRLQEENDRREELLKKEQELEARRTLGGNTPGKQEVEKPKEQTPKDFKDEFMQGKHKFPDPRPAQKKE